MLYAAMYTVQVQCTFNVNLFYSYSKHIMRNMFAIKQRTQSFAQVPKEKEVGTFFIQK